MLTFGAYRNEVAERGLDAELFPKVNREIRTALEINKLSTARVPSAVAFRDWF
jgi:hypothetical protein